MRRWEKTSTFLPFPGYFPSCGACMRCFMLKRWCLKCVRVIWPMQTVDAELLHQLLFIFLQLILAQCWVHVCCPCLDVCCPCVGLYMSAVCCHRSSAGVWPCAFESYRLRTSDKSLTSLGICFLFWNWFSLGMILDLPTFLGSYILMTSHNKIHGHTQKIVKHMQI